MSIPVLKVEGRGIADTWENSLVELWNKGIRIKTQYDKPEDPLSRDAMMIMIVNDPFYEPRIHQCFCGGFADLEKYRQEVIEGVHDHWIDLKGEGWKYTYHKRLRAYEIEGSEIDQIDLMIKKLAETPYTRRAIAITGNPIIDKDIDDPPCLREVWGGCVEGEDRRLYFNMIATVRSRDAYKAAFQNMYAWTELQKIIAEGISNKRGENVRIGQYVDISYSYHIYGSDFEDFNKRFLANLRRRQFYSEKSRESRTIRSDHPLVLHGFETGRKMLEMERKTGVKGVSLV